MSGANVTLHWCLVGVYSVLWIFSGIQTSRILIYRHSITSFQFAFHILCFSWNLLRAVFFGSGVKPWPKEVILSIYWYPIDIQFATFSLIVMYYAFLLHRIDKRRSDAQSALIVWCYVITNICVVSTTTFYIILACKSTDGTAAQLESAHHFFMAFQFLGLVCSYGYYGTLVVNSQAIRQAPDHLTKTSSSTLQWITAFMWLVFLSRLVYDIASACGVWVLNVGATASGYDDVASVILLFFWEVIPTSILLFAFRNIPRTSYGFNNFLFSCFRRQTPKFSINGDSLFEDISGLEEPILDDESAPLALESSWYSPSLQPSPFAEDVKKLMSRQVFSEKKVGDESVFDYAKCSETDEENDTDSLLTQQE